MIARTFLTAAVLVGSLTAAHASGFGVDPIITGIGPYAPPVVIGPYTPPSWVGPCPELGECPTPWGKETEPSAVASAEPGYWIMDSALPFDGLAAAPARKTVTIDPTWLLETDSAWIDEIEAQLN